eukprot:Partr_v1_DN27758_c0_g1_i1_m67628 putative ATP-binding cassette, sub-family G (WHITE), member
MDSNSTTVEFSDDNHGDCQSFISEYRTERFITAAEDFETADDVDTSLADIAVECHTAKQCANIVPAADEGAFWLPLTITLDDLACRVPAKSSIFSKKRKLLPRTRSKGDKEKSPIEVYAANEGLAARGGLDQFIAVEMSTFTDEMPTGDSEFDPDFKTVLHPMSCTIMPGELLAVMGPSGSGKTTFLEVLSQRIPQDRIDGRIFVNNIQLDRDIARKCFGYVWQHDALHENLTVRETLEFICQLRFKYSNSEMKDRVRSVIEELGLVNCANTRVGGRSFRGISGGERKRLSIGIELLANPSVLFLDEPTTGLDSTTALNIVQTLKTLALKNRTVVFTIHQPQTSIYRLFDKVLLMGRGGHVVYFGEGRHRAVDYFDQLGFQCDAQTNPSDHFLDIINSTSLPKKSRRKSKHKVEQPIEISVPETYLPEFYAEMSPDDRVRFLVQSYKSSALHRKNLDSTFSVIDEFDAKVQSPSTWSFSNSMARIGSIGSGKSSETEGRAEISPAVSPGSLSFGMMLSPSLNRSPSYECLSNNSIVQASPNILQKFWTLCRRHSVEYRRNKAATVFRVLQSAIIGVFIGLVYFQAGTAYDQKAAQDRRGVLFFLSLQQAMLGCITILSLFHGWERIVFQREYASSLYSAAMYYLSKCTAELPLQIASPILFSFITYFMVGLSQSVEQFLIYMADVTLVTFCGQALGIALSAWTPGIDVGSILAPSVLGMAMLCAGFFINVNHVPNWLQWTVSIDFITYSNQILAVNDLTGLNFTCDGPMGAFNGTMPTDPTQFMPKMSRWQRFWYTVTSPFRKKPEMPPGFVFPGTEGGNSMSFAPCIFRTGEEMLESMSFENVSISTNFGILVGICLGLHLLAYLGIRYYVAGKLKK